MRLEALIERLGEDWSLALAGLLIGLAFGFLAQRSRFCLRSAVIEFSRRTAGGKLTQIGFSAPPPPPPAEVAAGHARSIVRNGSARHRQRETKNDC